MTRSQVYRSKASAARRSGLGLLAVSYAALVMVGTAIPHRWWLGTVAFTLVALLTAWAAGGELRDAREHRGQADWIEADR